MRQIDFYLDFMSPFACLAHQRLPGLAHQHGYTLNYLPIDLPAAKKAAGNIGPPNVKIPVKLRYMLADVQRWARAYGMAPLKMPKTLNSAAMNKGLFHAIDHGQAEAYAEHAFELGWGEGADLGDPALLRQLAGAMKWSADEFLAYVESPAAATRYDEVNRAAQARGVFGVPTMMIGEEMWWGNDRLDFLETFVASAARSEKAA